MRLHGKERRDQPKQLVGLKRKPGKRLTKAATPIAIEKWIRLLDEQRAPPAALARPLGTPEQERSEWLPVGQ